MATNRIGRLFFSHGCPFICLTNGCMLSDILDPALLRPGRIDRKIEFPPPGPEARVSILRIHSRKVSIFSFQNNRINTATFFRCHYSVASIYAHWLRRWDNVLVLKYAVSAQKQACTLSVNEDNTWRKRTSSLLLLRCVIYHLVSLYKFFCADYNTGTEKEPRREYVSQQAVFIDLHLYLLFL